MVRRTLVIVVLALLGLLNLAHASNHYITLPLGAAEPKLEQLTLLQSWTFTGDGRATSANYPNFEVAAQFNVPFIGTDSVTLTLYYTGRPVCSVEIREDSLLGYTPCEGMPSVTLIVADKGTIGKRRAVVGAFMYVPVRSAEQLRVQERAREQPEHTLSGLRLGVGERKRFFLRMKGDDAAKEYALTWLGEVGTWTPGADRDHPLKYGLLRIEREGRVINELHVTDGLAEGLGPEPTVLLAQGRIDRETGEVVFNGHFLWEPHALDPRRPPALPPASFVVESLRINDQPDSTGRSITIPILNPQKNEYFRLDLALQYPGVLNFEEPYTLRTLPVQGRTLRQASVDVYLVKDDAFELFCVQNGGNPQGCTPLGRALFESPGVRLLRRGGELHTLIFQKLLQEVWNLPPGAFSVAYPSYPRYWGSPIEVLNTQRVGFLGRLSVNNWAPGDRKSLTLYYPNNPAVAYDPQVSLDSKPSGLEVSLRQLAPGRYKVYLLFTYEVPDQVEQWGGDFYQSGYVEVPEVPLRVNLDQLAYGDKTGCALTGEIMKTLQSGGKSLKVAASASGVPGAAVLFTVRQASDFPRKEDDAVYSHVDVAFDEQGRATLRTGDSVTERDPETNQEVTQRLGEDALHYYPGARRIEIEVQSNMQGGAKARSAWTCDQPVRIEFTPADFDQRLSQPEARLDRTLQQVYIDYRLRILDEELAAESLPDDVRQRVHNQEHAVLVDSFVKPVLAERAAAEAEAVADKNKGLWKDVLFLNVFQPDFWNRLYSKLAGETGCLERLSSQLERVAEQPGQSARPTLQADCGNFVIAMLAEETRLREDAAGAGKPMFELSAEDTGRLLLDTGDKFLQDETYDRAMEFYQTFFDLKQKTGCCGSLEGRAQQSVATLNRWRIFWQWTSFAVSTFAWVGCSFTPAAPLCGVLGAVGLGVMTWDLKTQWSQLSATQRTVMVGVILFSTIMGVRSGLQRWGVYKARVNLLREQRGYGLLQAAWRALKRAENARPNSGWRAARFLSVDNLKRVLSFGRWSRWKAGANALAGTEHAASLAARARVIGDYLRTYTGTEGAFVTQRAIELDRILRRLPKKQADAIRTEILAGLREAAGRGGPASKWHQIVEARTGQRAITRYRRALQEGGVLTDELSAAMREEADLAKKLMSLDSRFYATNVRSAGRLLHDALGQLRQGKEFHYVFGDLRNLGNVGLNAQAAGLPRHLAEQAKDIVLEETFKRIQTVVAKHGGKLYRNGGDEIVLLFDGSLNTAQVESALAELSTATRMNQPPEALVNLAKQDPLWEPFTNGWSRMRDLRALQKAKPGGAVTAETVEVHTAFGYVPKEQVRRLTGEVAARLERLQYTAEAALKKAAGKEAELRPGEAVATREVPNARAVAVAEELSGRPLASRINERLAAPYERVERELEEALVAVGANPNDKAALQRLADAYDAARTIASVEAKFPFPNFFNSPRLRSLLASTLGEEEVVLVGVELNHLKELNTLSYEVGDKALDATARTVSKSVEGVGAAARVESKRFVLFIPRSALRGKSLEEFARHVTSEVRNSLQEKLGSTGLRALEGTEGEAAFSTFLDSERFGARELDTHTRAQALLNTLSESLENVKVRARQGLVEADLEATDALQALESQRTFGGNSYDEVSDELGLVVGKD